MVDTCVFCKIAAKQLPAKVRYEDDDFLIFDDLYPKAKLHVLVIPKKHIATLNDVEDSQMLGNLLFAAQKYAKSVGVSAFGYAVKIHVNAGGGQEVFHLHVHLLSDAPS